MPRPKTWQIERVLETARLLEELAEECVFVGGAVLGLLLTDPAVSQVRPTMDVDVVVELATRGAFYRLQERLRSKGFREDMESGIICRWRQGPILLDGRPEIVGDVASADDAVRGHLAEQMGILLADAAFLDALPGHLPGDSASQQRIPLIEKRLRDIAGLVEPSPGS